MEIANIHEAKSQLSELVEYASALYESLGYTLAGMIPDYALKPHGGLTATMIYWKRPGKELLT